MLQNSKVCTYCVKIEYKVNQASCEMTKPETCDDPKDLKNGQCMCPESRWYGFYGYPNYGYKTKWVDGYGYVTSYGK